MNGKPQSGLFTKYVSFPFEKKLYSMQREASYICMQSAGLNCFKKSQLLFMLISWFLLNLSSFKYNFTCFLAYPNPQNEELAWCLVPQLLLLLIIILTLGLKTTALKLQSHAALVMDCVMLGKERRLHFFGLRNVCKLRKCETGIGIHRKLAVLEVLGCSLWTDFCPFACSVCSKICLSVPEK